MHCGIRGYKENKYPPRWIAEAWEKVTTDTIKKCFRSSGILDSKFELRSLDTLNGEDPFEDGDVDDDDARA